MLMEDFGIDCAKMQHEQLQALLLLAAENNSSGDAVNMLVEAGAYVRAVDNEEWTPLHYCSAGADPYLGRSLLDYDLVDGKMKSLIRRLVIR